LNNGLLKELIIDVIQDLNIALMMDLIKEDFINDLINGFRNALCTN
jgi:hypothetical protein